MKTKIESETKNGIIAKTESEIKTETEIFKTKTSPKKFFLLGSNIGHSLSPLIHTCIFDQLNLNATYNLLDTKISIGKLTRQDIKSLCLHADGFNVTSPFKSAIVPFLDQDFTDFKSANTIKIIRESGLNGKNLTIQGFSTDGQGFMLDAKRLDLDLSSVAVIGTGGAARAICFALKQNNISFDLVSQSQQRISDLFIELYANCPQQNTNLYLSEQFFNLIKNKKISYSLIINCSQNYLDLPNCYNLNYFQDIFNQNKKTKISSIGMLIYQAVLSAQIFFDIQIDLKIFDFIKQKTEKEKNILFN
ncbi:MAG: hypothetical protein FWD86_01055 [Firmicutes bacterium]|nr:hypothetical protein [Bacillota bacterium]